MGGPGSGRHTKEVEAQMRAEGKLGGKGSGRYPKGSKVGTIGTDEYERNLRTIQFNKQLFALPQYDTTDPMEVGNRFAEYLGYCEEYGMKPVPSSFAMALGLPASTLTKLMNGTYRTDRWPSESLDVISRCYDFLEATAEAWLLDPANRGAAQSIFQLKNRFGWRDVKEEIRVDARKELPKASDRELAALEQKYLAQAGVVEAEVENG